MAIAKSTSPSPAEEKVFEAEEEGVSAEGIWLLGTEDGGLDGGEPEGGPEGVLDGVEEGVEGAESGAESGPDTGPVLSMNAKGGFGGKGEPGEMLLSGGAGPSAAVHLELSKFPRPMVCAAILKTVYHCFMKLTPKSASEPVVS